MPEERELAALRRARDSGLRRLKALTAVLAVGMAVLAGAVAALAASTVPGRKIVHAILTHRVTARPHRAHPTAIPPPPPLPSAGSNASPSATPPPAPAPAAPSSAPVAVSGGS